MAFRIAPSSLPGAGRGVFAARDLRPGEVVGWYPGAGASPRGPEWADYSFQRADGETLFPDPAEPGVHLCNDAVHPRLTGRRNNAAFRELPGGEDVEVPPWALAALYHVAEPEGDLPADPEWLPRLTHWVAQNGAAATPRQMAAVLAGQRALFASDMVWESYARSDLERVLPGRRDAAVAAVAAARARLPPGAERPLNDEGLFPEGHPLIAFMDADGELLFSLGDGGIRGRLERLFEAAPADHPARARCEEALGRARRGRVTAEEWMRLVEGDMQELSDAVARNNPLRAFMATPIGTDARLRALLAPHVPLRRPAPGGVAVVAEAPIPAGEEVLVGYGWRYWDDPARDERFRRHPAVVLSRLLQDEVRAGGSEMEVHMIGEATPDPASDGTIWDLDARIRSPVHCMACKGTHAVGDWAVFVSSAGEVALVCDRGGRAPMGTLSEAGAADVDLRSDAPPGGQPVGDAHPGGADLEGGRARRPGVHELAQVPRHLLPRGVVVGGGDADGRERGGDALEDDPGVALARAPSLLVPVARPARDDVGSCGRLHGLKIA